MLNEIRRAVTMLAVLTVITGVAYPLLVTGIGAAAFPAKARGSLIETEGRVAGSRLIGQPFSDPKHFWSRPSATAPFPYNAAASVGSNQSPLNPALADAVATRIKALRDADPDNSAPVPVDLVTTSGSGLDPHISPAAAAYQLGRVARARNIDRQRIAALVAAATESRQLGFLGEPRVNVLELNLALDALK
jgi:K+-transporting ATPase ATPase C chain